MSIMFIIVRDYYNVHNNSLALRKLYWVGDKKGGGQGGGGKVRRSMEVRVTQLGRPRFVTGAENKKRSSQRHFS